MTWHEVNDKTWKARKDKTRQDKTWHDMKRQERTRHDMAWQVKTGKDTFINHW